MNVAAKPLKRGALLEFAWGDLRPLRIRARVAAEGLYSGMHRSVRRGPGVEFGGYRTYYPGDDLRLIDRRALLRYDKLQVREFETETERAVRVLVDASASMAYSGAVGSKRDQHISKYAYAALLAAGLAHITLRGGDPFGTLVFGGARADADSRSGRAAPALQQVPSSASRSTFERVAELYESVHPGGDLATPGATSASSVFGSAVAIAANHSRAGSVLVLFSDLLDVDESAALGLAELTQRRRVAVVQILDPSELDFPFEGAVRLRSAEGNHAIDTSGDVRKAYQLALAEHKRHWQRELEKRGARFLSVVTRDAPAIVLRQLLELVR
jgi:uncharacterized protein (DUF58 family)